MKEIKKNVLLTFGSAIFSIFLIEFFSLIAIKLIDNRFYRTDQFSKIKLNSNKDQKGIKSRFSFNTHSEFRLSRPAPYKDSAYFEWFIKEEWTNEHPECKTTISHDGKGYDLSINDTPNCRGNTIINGWRVTTDQPQNNDKNMCENVSLLDEFKSSMIFFVIFMLLNLTQINNLICGALSIENNNIFILLKTFVATVIFFFINKLVHKYI